MFEYTALLSVPKQVWMSGFFYLSLTKILDRKCFYLVPLKIINSANYCDILLPQICKTKIRKKNKMFIKEIKFKLSTCFCVCPKQKHVWVWQNNDKNITVIWGTWVYLKHLEKNFWLERFIVGSFPAEPLSQIFSFLLTIHLKIF